MPNIIYLSDIPEKKPEDNALAPCSTKNFWLKLDTDYYAGNLNQHIIYPFFSSLLNQVCFTFNSQARYKKKNEYDPVKAGRYKFVVTGDIKDLEHVRIFVDLESAATQKNRNHVKNHDDFVQGRPVLFAGYTYFNMHGMITAISNESGHYKINFDNAIIFIKWFMTAYQLPFLCFRDYSQTRDGYYEYQIRANDTKPSSTQAIKNVTNNESEIEGYQTKIEYVEYNQNIESALIKLGIFHLKIGGCSRFFLKPEKTLRDKEKARFKQCILS